LVEGEGEGEGEANKEEENTHFKIFGTCNRKASPTPPPRYTPTTTIEARLDTVEIVGASCLQRLFAVLDVCLSLRRHKDR
jgi:hypothetical protein